MTNETRKVLAVSQFQLWSKVQLTNFSLGDYGDPKLQSELCKGDINQIDFFTEQTVYASMLISYYREL